MYIVRILVVWYNVQKMYIRWNNTMSDSFSVSNGVRQGGILSPYLFCVYMDDLERRGSVVVSTSAWHASGWWFDSRTRHVPLLGVKTWLSTGIVYL